MEIRIIIIIIIASIIQPAPCCKDTLGTNKNLPIILFKANIAVRYVFGLQYLPFFYLHGAYDGVAFQTVITDLTVFTYAFYTCLYTFYK
jgi:hypothetical protein